ncbi:MAG: hypothetical protein Q8P64_15350 [Deltaproteobacteria bacterium]|nr:hypothetical protein [Deltaproteobacteria bacterium]
MEDENCSRDKKGGNIMRRFLKVEIILSILIVTFLVMIAAENSEAQQYINFSGKVINLQRGNITVQGDKGEVMNFAVGRRTIYVPSRLPGVGERVRITYYFQRGHNVGYQVEILPPPSPPKKK